MKKVSYPKLEYMKEIKNKRKKYGHIMVERETFEKARVYVVKNGRSMNWFCSQAIEAALKNKAEEK